MSLFGSIVGAFTTKAAKTGVSAIASMDPETATDIDCRQREALVQQRAELLAKAMSRKNDIQTQLNDATATKDRMVRAVELLTEKGKPDTDPAILEALSKAESESASIKQLTADLAQATSTVAQYQESHQDAVTKWETARRNMQAKIADNARLDDQLSRAKEAQHDAKVAAGLDTGIDATSIISDSFDEEAKKKQEEINAISATTSALGNANASSSELDAALKEVDGAPSANMTVAERLAALKS